MSTLTNDVIGQVQ